MKRAILLLFAVTLLIPACKKKAPETSGEDESKPETSEKAAEDDEAEASGDEAEKASTPKKAPEPEAVGSTDDTNEDGGFRSPTEIALRELPFEPCRQVHKTEDGQLIRTFEHVYEDGKLMAKRNLTADDTVRAAWSYEYDDNGQRIRAMRDDVPEGRDMKEPDLIISYEWKDGKLVGSAWAFAKEPEKTWRNSFEYDGDGKLVKVVSDGFPTDPPRDDNEPRVWSFEYDDKGYLMRRTRRPQDGDAPSRYTDFSYKNSKLARQTHRADIQGEWQMQFDSKFGYDGDQLAKQALEWGHANFGTEMITYEYECE
jgi:YD repeat-containing protein